MSEPHTYADVDVELVTAATEQHHIDFRRTDAMGNNPCVCDEWWDSVAMPGWDEHMAEVAVAALSAEGRLRTAAGHRAPFAGLLGVRTSDGRVYAPEDVVFIYLPADPPTSGDDTMSLDLREFNLGEIKP